MKLRSLTLLGAAALGSLAWAPAQACSAEPLLGSICVVSYNFCPRGFAQASGQLMSIATNTALFSLLGTQFGGDGRVTFGLPNLSGRSIVGAGSGPGLSPIQIGEMAGTETVTLTVAQMPAHAHTGRVRANSGAGTTDNPVNASPAKLARSNLYSSNAPDSNMAAGTVVTDVSGGSQPVSTRNPYLGMTICIATEGIYPSRN